MLDDPDLTVTEIAKTFDVSRATIYRHLDPTKATAAPAEHQHGAAQAR